MDESGISLASPKLAYIDDLHHPTVYRTLSTTVAEKLGWTQRRIAILREASANMSKTKWWYAMRVITSSAREQNST
jgi:hypothetical protein